MSQKLDSQQLNLKFKGLYTSANELSANPDGAMSIADNVVIDFDNLLQSRRGFGDLGGTLPSDSDRTDRLTLFQGDLIAHYNGETVARYDQSNELWQAYPGVFEHPNANTARLRFLEANNSLFFTTSTGIYKLDQLGADPRLSGGLKALDMAGTTSGVTGFLPDNSQVAYRAVWGYVDSNDILILGTVSNRAIVSNSTGGTTNVSLTLTVPEGATTSYFFQVYRSAASAGSAIEPTDELQLVYEANPTSGEISTGTVTFTDITPDSLKGATLYTSPSEGGIVQDNEPPPLSKDFCTFRGYTFYANTESKQRLFLTLIAVGGSGGIQIGDQLTIAGTTYTAAVAENAALDQFELVTAGTPSQNISDTAQSLARVINRSPTNTTVNALYTSGYNDLPGQMVIEEVAFGGGSYSASITANGTAFRPALDSVGTVSSSNDTFAHAVYYSKANQPEAVPLANQFFIGSASEPILRIIPLRDSVFVLKTDGIFRITGVTPANFVAEPFDATTKLFAPDSAQVLANEIWMLSDQGVVSVSDSGVQVRSRPIDNDLNILSGRALDAMKYKTFAVSYETDRKYLLFTISNSDATNPSQAYVFNIFTNTWVRWIRSQTCGFVNPRSNKLYLGRADSNNVSVERKDYSFSDYIDEQISLATVISYDADTRTLVLSSAAGISAGDVVVTNSTVYGVIRSVDLATNTLILSPCPNFVPFDSVVAYKGISNSMEWTPSLGQNPGQTKQWPEVSALFKSSRFFSALFRFRSELSQSYSSVTIDGTSSTGWGQFPWGSIPWSGTLQAKPIRTYVPANKQYCAQLTFRMDIKSGYSDWKLLGASLPWNSISFETTK